MIDMSCDLLTDVVMMSANSKCPSRQGILDCQTSTCRLVYIRVQRTCAPGVRITRVRIYVRGFQVCWSPNGIDWLLIKLKEQKDIYIWNPMQITATDQPATHNNFTKQYHVSSYFRILFEPKILWKLPYLESRLKWLKWRRLDHTVICGFISGYSISTITQ